jgi:hypothetical protein
MASRRNLMPDADVFMHMRRLGVIVAVGLLAILFAGIAVFAAGRGDLVPGTPGRQSQPAPIDRVEVVVRESAPPQVALRVTAGLPSGCAKPGTYTVTRAGDTITVTVLNSLPTGDQICTAIYGTYDLNIDLGSDFHSGVTYTVKVNDKTTTFKI